MWTLCYGNRVPRPYWAVVGCAGGGDVGGRGIVGGGPRALQASIRWLGRRLWDLGVVARSLHWSATTRRSVIGWSAVVQGKDDFSLL